MAVLMRQSIAYVLLFMQLASGAYTLQTGAYTLQHTVLKGAFPRPLPPKTPATPGSPATVFQVAHPRPLLPRQPLLPRHPKRRTAGDPLAFAVPVPAMLAFAAPGLVASKTRLLVTLIVTIGLIGGRIIYRRVCKTVEECPVPPADWWRDNALAEFAVATAAAGAEAAVATASAAAAVVSEAGNALSEDAPPKAGTA